MTSYDLTNLRINREHLFTIVGLSIFVFSYTCFIYSRLIS